MKALRPRIIDNSNDDQSRAEQFRKSGQTGKALRLLQRAVAKNGDSTVARLSLAIVHIDRNDIEAAIEEFRRILTREPDNIEVNVRLASLQAGSGRSVEAVSFYEKALSLDAHCGDAYYGLASLHKLADSPHKIEDLYVAFRSPDAKDSDRILLGFALGRVYEQLGQYDRAFAILVEANRLQRITIQYAFEQHVAMFELHRNELSREFIEHCEPACVSDQTPILVLGMPRSGTSLVEQILASHPAVYGAGEVEHVRILAEDVRKMTGKPFPENIQSIAPQRLRELALDYLKRLRSGAGDAERVVDKLPHNFLRIGLFAALLPNARIILCERDPIDNCVSIFQHPFTAAHGYASNLIELGEYFRLYQRMIAHWTQLLPNQLYRMNYESLVADPENQIKALLDYCSLPFHNDCLSFQDTIRFVGSPSASEVRQPIFHSSIDKGKRYEKHLQPLIEALAK